jgi:hypothetical protein
VVESPTTSTPGATTTTVAAEDETGDEGDTSGQPDSGNPDTGGATDNQGTDTTEPANPETPN